MLHTEGMLLRAVRDRYQCDSYSCLCERVASVVDASGRLGLRALMMANKFIPAGNTLLAGAQPIRPNCCIMPNLTEQNFNSVALRSERLWRVGIGIGYCFNEVTDPVSMLLDLSRRNAQICLGFRPIRGNIGVLDVEHPQAMQFIRCKTSPENTLFNFNISVSLSNAFMNRVLEGNALANMLLKEVAESACACGEPGVVFIDKARVFGSCIPLPSDLPVPSTLVPCGEQVMFENEACNLGSLNLARISPDDEGALSELVRNCVRCLDSVADLLHIPDDCIAAQTKRMRRVGLGVMGFADMCRSCGIKYGSEECLSMIDRIGAVIRDAARAATRELAAERGGLDFCPDRRNATVTCVAPTGGITLLTKNSGYGIEPFFDEATRVDPKAHLAVQARWQKYIENGISKTVNLPSDTTAKQIFELLVHAFEISCKSLTVFRDGCLPGQPISCVDGCAFTPSRCSRDGN